MFQGRNASVALHLLNSIKGCRNKKVKDFLQSVQVVDVENRNNLPTPLEMTSLTYRDKRKKATSFSKSSFSLL